MTIQQTRFKKLNDKLKELSAKYGSMCILQIIAILTVLTVFILTFLFRRMFKKKTAVKIIEKVATNTPIYHDYDFFDELLNTFINLIIKSA